MSKRAIRIAETLKISVENPGSHRPRILPEFSRGRAQTAPSSTTDGQPAIRIPCLNAPESYFRRFLVFDFDLVFDLTALRLGLLDDLRASWLDFDFFGDARRVLPGIGFAAVAGFV